LSDISVVIPTKNRADHIGLCLESIFGQTMLPRELVIVDSSDTRELEVILERFDGRGVSIEYIFMQANPMEARNIGAEYTSGDILTFIDDDTVLDQDCLMEISRVFEQDQRGIVGATTAEYTTPDSNMVRNFVFLRILLPMYQVFARIFLLLRYGDGKLLISGHSTIIRPGSIKSPVSVEYVTGANMSFRRAVFFEFKFDKAISFEDNDISFRVSRKYDILYVPSARYQNNRALSGGQGGVWWYIKDIRGYRNYFRKNFPDTLKYRIAFYWSALGMFIRGLVGVALRPILRRR
tara:strand:- start:2430 stop:3308 length:879 start_codon:yes stop_codon:yes gene_type:complete